MIRLDWAIPMSNNLSELLLLQSLGEATQIRLLKWLEKNADVPVDPCVFIFRLHSHCILYSYLLTCILPEFHKTMTTRLITSPKHHCLLGYFTHMFFTVLYSCSLVTLPAYAPKNIFLSLVMGLTPVTLAAKRLRQNDHKLRAALVTEEDPFSEKNINSFSCAKSLHALFGGLQSSATVNQMIFSFLHCSFQVFCHSNK